MSTRPSLNDWKKENPGRSIHEYYEEYPDVGNAGFNAPIPPPIPVIIPPKKKKKSINFVNILCSLLVGVGFMMPWIKIDMFGTFEGITEGTGYNLAAILAFLIKDLNEIIYESILLIPIGAFSALLGGLIRSWLVKLMGQISVIAVFFYWTFLIYRMVEVAEHELKVDIDFFQVFGFGFYLTGIAVIYYIYDVFFGK